MTAPPALYARAMKLEQSKIGGSVLYLSPCEYGEPRWLKAYRIAFWASGVGASATAFEHTLLISTLSQFVPLGATLGHIFGAASVMRGFEMGAFVIISLARLLDAAFLAAICCMAALSAAAFNQSWSFSFSCESVVEVEERSEISNSFAVSCVSNSVSNSCLSSTILFSCVSRSTDIAKFWSANSFCATAAAWDCSTSSFFSSSSTSFSFSSFLFWTCSFTFSPALSVKFFVFSIFATTRAGSSSDKIIFNSSVASPCRPWMYISLATLETKTCISSVSALTSATSFSNFSTSRCAFFVALSLTTYTSRAFSAAVLASATSLSSWGMRLSLSLSAVSAWAISVSNSGTDERMLCNLDRILSFSAASLSTFCSGVSVGRKDIAENDAGLTLGSSCWVWAWVGCESGKEANAAIIDVDMRKVETLAANFFFSGVPFWPPIPVPCVVSTVFFTWLCSHPCEGWFCKPNFITPFSPILLSLALFPF